MFGKFRAFARRLVFAKKTAVDHYEVDNNGIVQVDVSGATTGAFLKKIKQLLYRLSEAE